MAAMATKTQTKKAPRKKAPRKRATRKSPVKKTPAPPEPQAQQARLPPAVAAQVEAANARLAHSQEVGKHAQTRVELEELRMRTLVDRVTLQYLPTGATLTNIDTSTGVVSYTIPGPI